MRVGPVASFCGSGSLTACLSSLVRASSPGNKTQIYLPTPRPPPTHPQDFARISTFLPNRHVPEIVRFFYAVQRTDEFSATRRKYLLRKRRERTENNSAARNQGGHMGIADFPAPLAAAQHAQQGGASGLPASRSNSRLPAEGGGGGAGPDGLPSAFQMGGFGRGRGRGRRPGGRGRWGSRSLEAAAAAAPAPMQHSEPANPAPPVALSHGPRSARRGATSVRPPFPLFLDPAPMALEDLGSDEDGGLSASGMPRSAARGRNDPAMDALFLEAVRLHGTNMKVQGREWVSGVWGCG